MHHMQKMRLSRLSLCLGAHVLFWWSPHALHGGAAPVGGGAELLRGLQRSVLTKAACTMFNACIAFLCMQVVDSMHGTWAQVGMFVVHVWSSGNNILLIRY